MSLNSPNLFVEINNHQFIFVAMKNDDQDEIKILQKNIVSIQGVHEKKITNFELVYKTIKNNIYQLEQNLDLVFKEVTLVINNFDCTLIGISGYKRLSGSQLAKENIAYIINSLKSKINEIENKKSILHIFNSKSVIDKKTTENIPIGLFGDFYSHELSFFCMNMNDCKNLHNIFKKCNLRVKKIISKNFIEGATIINNNPEVDTFFKIELNKNDAEIFFFENSSLKFCENFKFGTDLIIQDISKIIALDYDLVKNILVSLGDFKNQLEDDLIEKKYFNEKNFRKIKKSLIIDIAKARIQEIAEVIMLKNINFQSFKKKNVPIFLIIEDKKNLNNIEDIFKASFSKDSQFTLEITDKIILDKIYENAYKIVQYGWKREAVPIVNEKQSIISRFFNLIFR